MGQVEYQLSEEQYPYKRRWKAAVSARSLYQGDIMKLLYEKFGNEGLKLISEVYSNKAKAVFMPGRKSFEIEGTGAKDFLLYFHYSGQIMYPMFKTEITPGSDEKKASVRYYGCPLWAEPAKVRGGAEMCEACLAFEKTAAAMINPKLKVYYSKLLTKGDSYCEITAEVED